MQIVTYSLNNDDTNTWQCSYCNEEWNLIDGNPFENNMNYCPKCGGKIDKVFETVYNSDIDDYETREVYKIQ